VALVFTCFAGEGAVVVGKWAEVGKPQNTMVFYEGNSVYVAEPDVAREGTWHIMKHGKIKVTLGDREVIGSVHGDTLILPGVGHYKKSK
jgi:hypothetical protein